MKKFNGIYRLSAAVTAGVMVGQSSDAYATATNTDLGGFTAYVGASAASLPAFISTIAYICGVGLAVAGIFKLKQHVDNPSQSPMKDGIIRLGAGGCLLTLPFIAEAMLNSMGNTDANTVSTMLTDAPIP